jgi:hypothetical protein
MQRINDWLYVAELEVVPGKYGKNPFTAVWPQPGTVTGTTSIDYSVIANTPGFLSLTVHSEYMGAYPSQGDASYNFDTHTGQVMTVRDLFTSQGIDTFSRQVRRARLKTIDDFVAKLPRRGKAPKATADELATVDDQRQFYGDCHDLIANGKIEDDQLTLDKDKLTLVREECAPHAMQAEDDLGPFENSYRYAAIANLLSDYGRCRLVEQRTGCANPVRRPPVGVYRGTMGDHYAITLVVGTQTSRDGYFYDRIGKLIELGVHDEQNGSYRFDESPDNGPAAVFNLKPHDGGLKGTWTQSGTGKTLSIDLH